MPTARCNLIRALKVSKRAAETHVKYIFGMFYGPVHPTVHEMARIESNCNLSKWRDCPPRVGYGVIYAGVSPITGKVYIGLHARGTVPESVSFSRWRQHQRGQGKCAAITAACKKYDIQWFVIEELPEQCLEYGEQLWIRSWNTMAPNGYNLTEGGHNGGRARSSVEKGILTVEAKQSSLREAKRATMTDLEKVSFDRKRCATVRANASNLKRKHGEDVPLVEKAEQLVTFRQTVEIKRQHRIDAAEDEAEASRLSAQFRTRDRNSETAKRWKMDPSLRTTHSERAIARESVRWSDLRELRANGTVEYKKCTACLETKASTEFGVQKYKSGWFGFHPTCKSCKAKKEKERRRVLRLASNG